MSNLKQATLAQYWDSDYDPFDDSSSTGSDIPKITAHVSSKKLIQINDERDNSDGNHSVLNSDNNDENSYDNDTIHSGHAGNSGHSENSECYDSDSFKTEYPLTQLTPDWLKNSDEKDNSDNDEKADQVTGNNDVDVVGNNILVDEHGYNEEDDEFIDEEATLDADMNFDEEETHLDEENSMNFDKMNLDTTIQSDIDIHYDFITQELKMDKDKKENEDEITYILNILQNYEYYMSILG